MAKVRARIIEILERYNKLIKLGKGLVKSNL
jgi:hypothetical protein